MGHVWRGPMGWAPLGIVQEGRKDRAVTPFGSTVKKEVRIEVERWEKI